MDWTSLYFKSTGLNVLILGTGEVATRRANKFLVHGADVRLVGNYISDSLLELGATLYSPESIDDLVEWCDLVVIASGDRDLSDYVCGISQNKLVNRADFPDEGNIIVPTSFDIGGVEISIFTNGKSPLMARQLRKKIQSIITEEDILEIELQDYSRSILKKYVSDQKERRSYLYRIFENEHIHKLIELRDLDNAKKFIHDMIMEDFDDT